MKLELDHWNGNKGLELEQNWNGGMELEYWSIGALEWNWSGIIGEQSYLYLMQHLNERFLLLG